MAGNNSEPPMEADTSQGVAGEVFDNYRSCKKRCSAFPFQSWRLGVDTIVDRTWSGNESPHCRKRLLSVSCKRGSDRRGGTVRSRYPVRRAGAEIIMALRDPEIPNHRERSTLQLMKHGNWVVRSDLYPAGKATIAGLVEKDWIEPGVNPKGARQFRITPAGRAALHARIR
jgi:hypothetical protein